VLRQRGMVSCSSCRSGLVWVVGGLAILSASAPGTWAQRDDINARLERINVRVSTEHYALSGTVTDKVLREYAQMLEFIYGEYAKGFADVLKDEQAASAKSKPAEKKGPTAPKGGKKKAQTAPAAETQPADNDASATSQPTMAADDASGRFRVLVFASENEYRDFGRDFLAIDTKFTDGMYISQIKVLMILDLGNPDKSRAVLFHEAFHQFLHRHVQNPPMWLDEGLAMYFGESRPVRGGLAFDAADTDDWRLCRKAIEKDEAIPLQQLVCAGRQEFYDHTLIRLSSRYQGVPRSALYYAQAYTLIHTLMNDATGTQRLRTYIRALAKDDGKSMAKITQEYFGPDTCAQMTPYWIRHVQERPENHCCGSVSVGGSGRAGPDAAAILGGFLMLRLLALL
jgi:hypothetical protein